MGKVYVITESISIQTFRQKIRTLLKVVTESVSIVHGFFLKLQYGLVTQGQTQSTYWTSESSSTTDTSQTTSTGINSESESTADSSQTISSGDTQESVEGGN
jgi:hypothetical protein